MNSNLFQKLKISSRVLNIEGDFNTALSNYVDSLKVFPAMDKIDKNLNYFSFNAEYRINKNFSARFGKGTTFIEMDIGQCFFLQIIHHIPYFTFITEFWKVKYYNHFTTFYDIYNSDISQKSMEHFII